MLEEFFDFSPRLLELDKQAMELCRPYFEKVDAIRDYNQVKMLKAFTDQKVAATHLVGTTGYGYDDAGRDKLDALFAQVVGAEDALCRPHFLSGTHALAVALFGVLGRGTPCWPPPAALTTPWKGSSASATRARAAAPWRNSA